jgi:phosphoglycolate phosphatase (TIGR01487 family)
VLKALLTDIDGTITDPSRRISTGSIETIRSLVDSGIEVVLASGNTSCFMDAISKMIGTKGTFIAENGGVFRIGFTGPLVTRGDQTAVKTALRVVQDYFLEKGIILDLYSPAYRFSDLAFARTVPVDEVKTVLQNHPVQVLDTGYAIHLLTPGINKGTALEELARGMGLEPADFLAIGDSLNDIPMLKTAGVGITVANAHPDTKAVAQYVAGKEYGDGFVEAVEKYYPYFRAR